MSFGRMSWEPPENGWRGEMQDQDWLDGKTWFVTQATGANYPYEKEVDVAAGPLYRMYWEQPEQFSLYRGASRRGSRG